MTSKFTPTHTSKPQDVSAYQWPGKFIAPAKGLPNGAPDWLADMIASDDANVAGNVLIIRFNGGGTQCTPNNYVYVTEDGRIEVMRQADFEKAFENGKAPKKKKKK